MGLADSRRSTNHNGKPLGRDSTEYSGRGRLAEQMGIERSLPGELLASLRPDSIANRLQSNGSVKRYRRQLTREPPIEKVSVPPILGGQHNLTAFYSETTELTCVAVRVD